MNRRGLETNPRVNFASYASKSALLRTVEMMIALRSCMPRQYVHTPADDGELATHLSLEDLNAAHVHVCVAGVAEELADLADLRVVGRDHPDVSRFCRQQVRSAYGSQI